MNNILKNSILGLILSRDEVASDYTFIFDPGKFELTLIPTTIETFNTDSVGVNKLFNNTNEWITEKEFKGVTSKNEYIMFRVEGVCDSVYGCIGCKVFWYCILKTNNWNDLNCINSVNICGSEIDTFYPVHQAYCLSRNSDESLKLVTNHSQTESISCFKTDKNTFSIKFNANVVNIRPFSKTPLAFRSNILVSSSTNSNLEEILKLIRTINNFFKFINYRENVNFDFVELISSDNDNNKKIVGRLKFFKKFQSEIERDYKSKQVIYEDISDGIANILSALHKDELPFEHYCSSEEDRAHYPIQRIQTILSAFELEYKNIMLGKADYKKEINKKTKNNIRLYSYKNKIVDTYSEYQYLEKYWLLKNKYYVLSNAEEFCERLRNCRNDLAHYNIGYDIKAVNLFDVRFVEVLLYAMRLKDSGLSDTNCLRVINKLF